MTLDEALAVERHVSALGYPNRDQLAALKAARDLIGDCAQEAIERHRQSRAKATSDRPESNGEQPLWGL